VICLHYRRPNYQTISAWWRQNCVEFNVDPSKHEDYDSVSQWIMVIVDELIALIGNASWSYLITPFIAGFTNVGPSLLLSFSVTFRYLAMPFNLWVSLQKYEQKLFSERVVVAWNSLPPSVVNFTSLRVKVGFHYPSSRPENSGAFFDTRQLGPSTRVVETGRPCTRAVYTLISTRRDATQRARCEPWTRLKAPFTPSASARVNARRRASTRVN